jgi:hypothetical protein
MNYELIAPYPLDTGLRRYDDIAGWAGFGKALDVSNC